MIFHSELLVYQRVDDINLPKTSLIVEDWMEETSEQLGCVSRVVFMVFFPMFF